MSSSFTREDLLAVFAEINSQEAEFPLSEQALRNLFTKGVFSRAQQMLRDEQVLWVKSSPDFSQIDAQVMDDDGTTFDQQIHLQTTNSPIKIDTHCSCGTKIRCKHIASALLQLKLQSQGAFAQHYQIEDWFGALTSSQQAVKSSHFILLFELQLHRGQLQVVPKVAANSAQGKLSQGRALTEQQSHAQVTPKDLDEDDFRLYSVIRSQNLPGHSALIGHWGARVLLQLVHTERLFFASERTALTLGKPHRLSYSWQYEGDQAYLSANLPDFDIECVLNTAPVFYVNQHSRQVIELETHLTATEIRQLHQFPRVQKHETEALSQRINNTLGPVLDVAQKKKTKAQFVVKLLNKRAPFVASVEGDLPTNNALRNLGFETCKGALRNHYLLFVAEQKGLSRTLFEVQHRIALLGGRLTNIPRSAINKVQVVKPRLVIKALKGHRLLGHFELGSDDHTISIKSNQLGDLSCYSGDYFYTSNSQHVLAIPSDIALRMSVYLQRFGEPKNTAHLAIPRSLYEELTQAQDWHTEIDPDLSLLLNKPTLASLRPVQLSKHVTLREYQHAGVNWLQLLSLQGLGAVLADDMGLGKTLQVIAYLTTLEQNIGRPHLIICPTSLVGNWLSEVARFAPHIKVQSIVGTNRTTILQNIASYDVVLTTYTLFKRDFAFYKGVDFHTIVLDEAQAIKNAQAQLSQKVKQLKARFRLALSGTPFENNLLELKSVFDFAMPGLLGGDSVFKSQFVEQDLSARQALSRTIKPYLLRRAKADVLCELPSKTELVKQLEMLPAQADVYQRYHSTLHNKLSHLVSAQGIGKSKLQFLDALLKLRQICCHPQLVDKQYQNSSAKLQWLAEHLPGMLAQDHHVIVFSQFTSMLRLIAQQLQDIGIDYALLTGQTRNRQNQVDDFQHGRKRVFLISLKAGGSGLNLTKADTVIHFDPWWNPAVEHQATDRAYRMGQDRSVFVYKLIIANSVEQQVMALADKKRNLVDEFLNGTLLSDKKIDDNQLLEMLNLEKEEKK